MNFTTLIGTLEPKFRRSLVSCNYGEIVSYEASTTQSVTINGTTLNNLIRLCLLHKGNDIYLYVNHSARYNRCKINLNDISTLVVS